MDRGKRREAGGSNENGHNFETCCLAILADSAGGLRAVSGGAFRAVEASCLSELSKASYNPDTGVVMMEADAQGRGGATIHYVIEGKLEGNTMTGTWNHDNRTGDFKISKG